MRAYFSIKDLWLILFIGLLFSPMLNNKGDNHYQNLPTSSLTLDQLTPQPAKPETPLAGLSEPQVNKVNIPEPKPTISYQVTSAEYIPPNPVEWGSNYNHFPFGQCTWYVANHRDIPWYGNAKDWYWNALVSGFKVGSTPQVGSIMVSQESNPLGHVSLVTAVLDSNTWIVSEMNALAGWGAVDSRTISRSEVYLYGFIY